ncbi:MAG: sugar phosphate nucleotidyltransferase [Candidatus Nomurabacteria bacterium]|nr:sugar phosphate nucleotidyltransferase [Candidatus Nomurabacteria bacterium]
MKVIIFAAGKGSRLQPITDTTPKPLIQINNKPILSHIIESLPDEITEIYIVGKHLIEQLHVFSKTHNLNKKITIVEQINSHTGTMAALLSVKDLFDLEKKERFLVLNGDDLQNKKELEMYLQYPRSFGVQHSHIPYYAIESYNGIVKGFRKQTKEELEKGGAKIATGTYVLDTEIFKFEPIVLSDGDIGLPQTILSQKDTYPIHIVETTKWIPINSHEDLQKAKDFIENK